MEVVGDVVEEVEGEKVLVAAKERVLASVVEGVVVTCWRLSVKISSASFSSSPSKSWVFPPHWYSGQRASLSRRVSSHSAREVAWQFWGSFKMKHLALKPTFLTMQVAEACDQK